MATARRYTKRDLAARVHWGGGVLETLENYGVMSEEITDQRLAADWREMSTIYFDVLSPLVQRAEHMLAAGSDAGLAARVGYSGGVLASIEISEVLSAQIGDLALASIWREVESVFHDRLVPLVEQVERKLLDARDPWPQP